MESLEPEPLLWLNPNRAHPVGINKNKRNKRNRDLNIAIVFGVPQPVAEKPAARRRMHVPEQRLLCSTP